MLSPALVLSTALLCATPSWVQDSSGGHIRTLSLPGFNCSSSHGETFLIDVKSFLDEVCCAQAGEDCDAAHTYPTSCRSTECARAVAEVYTPCMVWLSEPQQAWMQMFKTSLQALGTRCEKTSTIPAGSVLLSAPSAQLPDGCGVAIFDGKREQVGSWRNSLEIKVPDQARAVLHVEALFLPSGDFVDVYDGSSRDAPLLGRLSGTERPTGPLNASGSHIFVEMVTDAGNEDKLVAVSLRVGCCVGVAPTCECLPGWSGASCDRATGKELLLKSPSWSYMACDCYDGHGTPVNATFRVLVLDEHMAVNQSATRSAAAVDGSCFCSGQWGQGKRLPRVGEAWSCSNSATGVAVLDLQGTGYAIDTTKTKIVRGSSSTEPVGSGSIGDCSFTAGNKVATVHGGGFCGFTVLEPLVLIREKEPEVE